jgi:hypothetical protein
MLVAITGSNLAAIDSQKARRAQRRLAGEANSPASKLAGGESADHSLTPICGAAAGYPRIQNVGRNPIVLGMSWGACGR